MTLLRVSVCVDAVDEDLVAIVNVGIILLGVDSGRVHGPLFTMPPVVVSAVLL